MTDSDPGTRRSKPCNRFLRDSLTGDVAGKFGLVDRGFGLYQIRTPDGQSGALGRGFAYHDPTAEHHRHKSQERSLTISRDPELRFPKVGTSC